MLPKKLHCGPTTVSWVKLISGCTPNTAMCRTITNGKRISSDKLGRGHIGHIGEKAVEPRF